MELNCPRPTSSKTLEVSNGGKENLTKPYAELKSIGTLDCYSLVKDVVNVFIITGPILV